MNKLLIVSLFFILSLFTAPSLVNAQLAITEVMPDTSSSQDASEWLEIFNYSPFSIPLSEIKINNKPLISELTELPPDNYLVITKNKQSFLTEFGDLDSLAEAGISLSNSGSTLELTLNENLIDSITYAQVQSLKSWQSSGFLCEEYVWQVPTIASQNSNYIEECNVVEMIDTESSIEFDDSTQELALVENSIKLFGFSVENNFTYGNIINNYLPPIQVIGYYFGNHKLYKTIPLEILPVSSQSSSSDSSTSSVSSSNTSTSLSSTTTSSVSSATLSATVSSISSSASSTTSQPAIPKIEISEVYAAPVSPDKEWLEIYNYGQDTNLSSCEIKDSVGKHKLSSELSSNSFLQVTDLKISLNNSGELLELYCSGQLVDSWQQPAVKSTETTMRKFASNRHATEIFITLQSTPGKENELVLTAVSSNSSSTSSVSKSSVVSGTKTQSIAPANISTAANTPTTIPRFSINNQLPVDSQQYKNEAATINLILGVAAFVQVILLVLAASRISNLRKLAKKLTTYTKHQLNGWLEVKDQKTKLQSLRY